jgi:CRISPR-associated protein (TIGR03986 family)
MSDRIASQYNFVPLPRHPDPVLPKWAPQVSMDVPFQDGVCGHLDVELTALSPLFIRGAGQERGRPQEPYRDHAGRFALPGTSLRGMLRSVVEIASFGKLGPVNDYTFGLRDLHTRHLYGDYMADIQRREDTGKNEPMPLVNAGWLSCEEHPDEPGVRVYKIYPCHFARVEYAQLERFARHPSINLPTFNPNDRQSATRKYKLWGEHADRLFTIPVRTLVSRGALSSRLKLKRLSEYGEYHPSGAKRVGRFVFTGQPQNRRRDEKRKKHHDFFFYGSTGDAPLTVTREQLQSFEMIHADGAEQHRDEINPNEEWGFWKRRLKLVKSDVSGEERLKASVPVFFIVHPQQGHQPPVLRSFGLAMMFRLAYDMSVKEVRRNSQNELPAPDLAALMFGYVELNDEDKQDDAKAALRGRVAVGQASLQGSAALVSAPVKAVLSAPKPTFYPAYIRQGVRDGGRPDSQQRGAGYRWASYMRETSPRLRGWKRYLARHQWVTRPKLPEKAGESVMTTFTPVKEGACFRFRITLHNLREVELGALLWALDFGGEIGEFKPAHSLGMARPLGYGRVSLKRVGHSLYGNDDITLEAPLSDERLAACVDRFRGYMSAMTKGEWARSETLRELCVCATPHPSGRDPEHLRNPEIAHPVNKNEFQQYKQDGASLPLQGDDQAYGEFVRALVQREQRPAWDPDAP